jgi:upstream activation factor subunit UAF30
MAGLSRRLARSQPTLPGSGSPSALSARTWAGTSGNSPVRQLRRACETGRATRIAARPGEPTPSKTPKEKATKAAPNTGGGKANALQKPLQPSEELAAVVDGPMPLSRSQAVSKVWDYIKAHNLKNPENRREILADDKLGKVFGKDKVTMFEMNKHLAQHLK